MKNVLSVILISVLVLLGCSASFAATNGWDNLAQTPPMGWNSWNTFRLEINEGVVRGMADYFVERGTLVTSTS